LNLVNVIIPVYNQAKYLEECVQSVLNQSFKKYSITIINDDSPDNAKEVINKISLKHKNIQILYTPDLGNTRCRNVGINGTKSKYFLLLDADDKIHKDFLKETVKILEDNPEIGFCYTDTQHFGVANSFWEQPDYNFFRLLQGNYICYCSLIRRIAFEDVGGYNPENYGYQEDYELWLRLGRKGWYGKHIPKKLFYYQIHDNNNSRSKRTVQFDPVYREFLITWYPEIFPEQLQEHAKQVVSQYPIDFMNVDHAEQEKYLKEN